MHANGIRAPSRARLERFSEQGHSAEIVSVESTGAPGRRYADVGRTMTERGVRLIAVISR